MDLIHIPLDQLTPSPLNVRKTGGKEIGDLAASIQSLGLLQPLLVRRSAEAYDIVAGQRRYLALSALAREGALTDDVPCLVMAEGDDARAIEASLAENLARLPMDEIDQHRAFAALKAEGLCVADIAARFAVTERLVEQRLAIAKIIPSILSAYRRGDITPDTLRILTMATPKQQKEWWRLFKSKDEYAPTGRSLRAWLFGGAQIPLSNAIFDTSAYEGAIIADLFGEERYVADTDAFWTLQKAAIAERGEAYRAAGWREVVILDIGEHFAQWNHVRTPKTKGGRAYIEIAANGEVTFHEGFLTEKEAKVRAKASAVETADTRAKPDRSELTATLRNYLDLHRHATVRTQLLSDRGLALRLAVAQMLARSALWTVEAEPQRAASEAVAASLSAAKAQSVFAEERRYVRSLLGWQNDEEENDQADETLLRTRHGFGRHPVIGAILQRLLELGDAEVMRILTFLVAESLSLHSPLIEGLGVRLGIDMRDWWTPDETFFALLRDKQAVNAMLREVAGDITADAHMSSTAKVQKTIIADCLAGEGRPKVEGWLPRYMRFPAGTYLGRQVDEGIAGHDGVCDVEDAEAA